MHSNVGSKIFTGKDWPLEKETKVYQLSTGENIAKKSRKFETGTVTVALRASLLHLKLLASDFFLKSMRFNVGSNIFTATLISKVNKSVL